MKIKFGIIGYLFRARSGVAGVLLCLSGGQFGMPLDQVDTSVIPEGALSICLRTLELSSRVFTLPL